MSFLIQFLEIFSEIIEHQDQAGGKPDGLSILGLEFEKPDLTFGGGFRMTINSVQRIK